MRHARTRSARGAADGPDAAEPAVRSLRTRWHTASITTGWRYPGDWAVPEVDQVCAAALSCRVDDLDPTSDVLVGALQCLCSARAVAGVGLDETLADLAALHAVLSTPEAAGGLVTADPDTTPTRLVRVAALAWADAALGEADLAGPADPLTGLANRGYLRYRLGEVYRRATRERRSPSDSHVLLAVTLDLSEVHCWSRLTAMVLVAEVLQEVFDGGETVAVLGPAVAAVLAERSGEFGRRSVHASWLIADRFRVDPHLAGAGRPVLRVETLPADQDQACALLSRIGLG